jgi:ribosomal protein L30/L7E
MTPQEIAEKIVGDLTALGCQAQFGPGMRGAWVSVGDGNLEEAVFDIGPGEVVMLKALWWQVGSVRRRVVKPDSPAISKRIAGVARLVSKAKVRREQSNQAWAVRETLRGLGLPATVHEGRVVIELSLSPEYAAEVGPKIAAVMSERKEGAK